jgi:transposase
MRVRIARDELRRLRELTQTIKALEGEIAQLVAHVAPQLLSEQTGIGATPAARASLASLAKRAAPAISPPGFGPLTAAKLVEEQFTSAREAFARSLEPGRRGKVVLTVAAA